MLKIIGIGIGLLSVAGGIYCLEGEFSMRKKQLHQFVLFLSLLRNEICELRKTIPDAMDQLQYQLPDPYNRLCADFYQALVQATGEHICTLWRRVCLQNKNRFVIKKEEWQTLLDMEQIFCGETLEHRERVFALLEKKSHYFLSEFLRTMEEKRG